MHCWAACCQSKIPRIPSTRSECCRGLRSALLWPLPATQSLSPFAVSLPGWRGIFKRWLREDPQSKIRFIFKIILNSQLTKYHLSFYFWLQKGTQTARSDFITGLSQEWLWVASRWALLGIFFFKCLELTSWPWLVLWNAHVNVNVAFLKMTWV